MNVNVADAARLHKRNNTRMLLPPGSSSPNATVSYRVALASKPVRRGAFGGVRALQDAISEFLDTLKYASRAVRMDPHG